MGLLAQFRGYGLFRTYDIRGYYPKDINGDVAYRIGRALVTYLKCKNVVVGRDVRLSSPEIFKGLAKGITDQGADVIDIGLSSTDVLYFAAGYYKYDAGIQITASHVSRDMNGMKFVGKNAAPIWYDKIIDDIKKIYEENRFEDVEKKGKVIEKNVWEDFVKMSFSFVDINKIKPLKIVFDAANSVGALIVEHAFKHLNCKVIPLYFELDGSFPNHDPNPFLEENRRDVVNAVIKEKADLGIAFDGDADRIYFVNEKGEYVFGAFIAGLIAEKMLKKNPGRVVLHDIRAWWYIEDIVKKNKGIPKRELVGHIFFKKRMPKENALFAGESSGHVYYNFKDFMVENSLIGILQVLELISTSGKTLSELTKDAIEKYPASGEINFEVPDQEKAVEKVEKKYSDGKVSHFDTLTVEFDDWHFNLRPSANDPVIRLTLEARNKDLMIEKTNEISRFIEQFGKRLPS